LTVHSKLGLSPSGAKGWQDGVRAQASVLGIAVSAVWARSPNGTGADIAT